MKFTCKILIAALFIPLFVAAQGDTQADAKRFAELKAKHDQGQTLSQEDMQWAQQYMKAHKGQQGGQQGGAANVSPEDAKKLADIKAKRAQGQQLTPEETQWVQQYMKAHQNQQGGQQAGQQQARQQQAGQQGGTANMSPEDAKRLADIKAKHAAGQPISQEDMQWAQQMMRQQGGQKGGRKGDPKRQEQNSEWAKANPPKDSTGLVPLPDLSKGNYKGEEGGLYPGGGNTPPLDHLKAGLAQAKQITPLDPDGKKSPNGKIVMLSIGMSNTTMEFQQFQKLAAATTGLNPKLVIVDGAQGGQTAKITATPDANFWKVVSDRLEKAGVTAKQVQIAWIKQANAHPTEGFPAAAKQLEADMVGTLHNLHDKFPNMKITYLSSRIYAGYATSPLNPEPYAYEGAFSMKWAIADQIAGKPELNYNASKGEVKSPWIAWGPYLWTDGLKGRKQDGVIWEKDDCVTTDRTHPSETGKEKVAKMLMDFLKSDPTSKSWFTAKM
jgi:hypothetical protein